MSSRAGPSRRNGNGNRNRNGNGNGNGNNARRSRKNLNGSERSRSRSRSRPGGRFAVPRAPSGETQKMVYSTPGASFGSFSAAAASARNSASNAQLRELLYSLPVYCIIGHSGYTADEFDLEDNTFVTSIADLGEFVFDGRLGGILRDHWELYRDSFLLHSASDIEPPPIRRDPILGNFHRSAGRSRLNPRGPRSFVQVRYTFRDVIPATQATFGIFCLYDPADPRSDNTTSKINIITHRELLLSDIMRDQGPGIYILSGCMGKSKHSYISKESHDALQESVSRSYQLYNTAYPTLTKTEAKAVGFELKDPGIERLGHLVILTPEMVMSEVEAGVRSPDEAVEMYKQLWQDVNNDTNLEVSADVRAAAAEEQSLFVQRLVTMVEEYKEKQQSNDIMGLLRDILTKRKTRTEVNTVAHSMGISAEYLTRLKEILEMDDDAIREILEVNNSNV